jgi:hypothetical protein
LGEEFIIIGERVVHAIEEVFYVVGDEAYTLLSAEGEVTQQHCYEDF